MKKATKIDLKGQGVTLSPEKAKEKAHSQDSRSPTKKEKVFCWCHVCCQKGKGTFRTHFYTHLYLNAFNSSSSVLIRFFLISLIGSWTRDLVTWNGTESSSSLACRGCGSPSNRRGTAQHTRRAISHFNDWGLGRGEGGLKFYSRERWLWRKLCLQWESGWWCSKRINWTSSHNPTRRTKANWSWKVLEEDRAKESIPLVAADEVQIIPPPPPTQQTPAFIKNFQDPALYYNKRRSKRPTLP